MFYEQMTDEVRKVVAAFIKHLDPDERTCNIIRNGLTKWVGEENFDFPYPITEEFVLQWMNKCGIRVNGYIKDGYTVDQSAQDIMRHIGLVQPVLVRFKKLIRKNPFDEELEIQDTYVYFQIRRDHFSSSSRMGMIAATRTTGPLDHVVRGYVHSHPAGFTGFGDFKRLCTGTSSEPMTKFTNERPRVTEKSFDSFMVSLKAYLEWENAYEGSSYHQIGSYKSFSDDESIGSISPGRAESVANWIIQSDILRSYTSEEIFNMFSITLATSGFEMPDISGETELKLGKMLVTKSQALDEGETAVRREDGEYVKAPKLENLKGQYEATYSKQPLLKFRGEDIYLKILDAVSNEDFVKLNIVPHPDITRMVKLRMIQILNSSLYKNWSKIFANESGEEKENEEKYKEKETYERV